MRVTKEKRMRFSPNRGGAAFGSSQGMSYRAICIWGSCLQCTLFVKGICLALVSWVLCNWQKRPVQYGEHQGLCQGSKRTFTEGAYGNCWPPSYPTSVFRSTLCLPSAQEPIKLLACEMQRVGFFPTSPPWLFLLQPEQILFIWMNHLCTHNTTPVLPQEASLT